MIFNLFAKKKHEGMVVWKDSSGQYRWLAVYSNNFRDNDKPPEILSKASHERFDRLVNTGEFPMPELRHWHVKGSTYGRSDWHTFDPETGFAIASGYILPGHEKEAESLSKMKDIAVSHGMPVTSIKRDSSDPSVIVEHQTIEISDLPRKAAANKLTHFLLITEETMAMPKEKRDYLKSVGVSDEFITGLEAQLKEVSETAQNEGIESKETPAPEVPKTEETTDKETQSIKDEIAQGIVTAVNLAVAPVLEQVKSLSDQVVALKAELEEKSKELTPSASIASIISKQMTATRSPETKLDGRDKLAKQAPVETKEDSANQPITIPGIIQGIIGGNKNE